MNRWDYARQTGIVDKAIALPRNPRETDDCAEAAEDLVRNRYGLPKPPRLGKDPGYDLVICHDPWVTADVKWTPRTPPHLKATAIRAHVYILVTGPDRDHLRIVGFQYGHVLACHVKDYGHGPTFAMEAKALHPNVDLLFQLYGHHPK